MIRAGTILERNHRVEFRALVEGGGVLLNQDTSQYHGVNSVGALVWRSLNAVTFEELLTSLRSHLTNLTDAFEEEITGFLEELIRRDLVRAVESP